MKTQPYRHQQECLDLSYDLPAFAILLEQGLGKTKVCLDTAERLFKQKRVEACLILAPKGVHVNWVRQEIPKHLDCPSVVLEWGSHRQSKRWEQQKFELFAPTAKERRLRILVMNVEALSQPGAAQELCQRFLKFPALMVVDESSRIKTPSAQRTKRVVALGKLARYRRILTGTPVTQSPFDLFTQFNFLDPNILRFHSYYAFRHEYGRWERKIAQQNGRRWEYEDLVEFKNLEQLKRRIAPYSYRRTKRECLDLPEKIYKTAYYDLTTEQRRHYSQLIDDGLLAFESFEELVPLQITRLLRCQQLLGGFVLDEPLPENPRLDLLLELVEDHPGKLIVWARFRAELQVIMARLKPLGDVVGLYGGSDRKELKRFQEGDARFLVGQQQSGIGVDLFAAETVVYFSNTFSYEQRYQTEDRCHRIGLRHPVVYIDLVARDTVDERIIEVLARATRTARELIDDRDSL